MKATVLYGHLEKDFIFSELSDDWARYMGEIDDYLCSNFKERSMGLVCDFADEINQVYTAVFPTDEIMNKILSDGAKNAMLFVHHPSIWDINRQPVFYQMNRDLLSRFKENGIAIYNLHVPLDHYSEYGTSKTLADALGIEIEKPFVEYHGGLCGIIGKTRCKTVEELQDKFAEIVGHRTKLYHYGESMIKNRRVAVVAGGGNNEDTVIEMFENHVEVLITGITAKNEFSSEFHQMEQSNNINVLGGTHYSTEKFACQKICNYFEGLGLKSEFIAGEPIFDDM